MLDRLGPPFCPVSIIGVARVFSPQNRHVRDHGAGAPPPLRTGSPNPPGHSRTNSEPESKLRHGAQDMLLLQAVSG
jgi:hypothetical protein